MTRWIGRSFFKILNVFASPITLSTCICLEAMRLSFTTWSELSWRFPFKNDGILILTSLEANRSCTVNLWSAIMLSPASNMIKSESSSDRWHICRSLALPSSLTYETRPLGVHPTKTFKVFFILVSGKSSTLHVNLGWFLHVSSWWGSYSFE